MEGVEVVFNYLQNLDFFHRVILDYKCIYQVQRDMRHGQWVKGITVGSSGYFSSIRNIFKFPLNHRVGQLVLNLLHLYQLQSLV